MTSAGDNDAIYIASFSGIDRGSLWRACSSPASRNPSISARPFGLSRSGEQLVQIRRADGLDQVPLDPHLAREFAAGVLTASRQRNQSQVL
jgi:hypothetical protein